MTAEIDPVRQIFMQAYLLFFVIYGLYQRAWKSVVDK